MRKYRYPPGSHPSTFHPASEYALSVKNGRYCGCAVWSTPGRRSNLSGASSENDWMYKCTAHAETVVRDLHAAVCLHIHHEPRTRVRRVACGRIPIGFACATKCSIISGYPQGLEQITWTSPETCGFWYSRSAPRRADIMQHTMSETPVNSSASSSSRETLPPSAALHCTLPPSAALHRILRPSAAPAP